MLFDNLYSLILEDSDNEFAALVRSLHDLPVDRGWTPDPGNLTVKVVETGRQGSTFLRAVGGWISQDGRLRFESWCVGGSKFSCRVYVKTRYPDRINQNRWTDEFITTLFEPDDIKSELEFWLAHPPEMERLLLKLKMKEV